VSSRVSARVKNIVGTFGARVKASRVSGSGDYVKVIPLACSTIGLLFIRHFALLQRKHVASWSNRAFERIFLRKPRCNVYFYDYGIVGIAVLLIGVC